ncbi:DUF4349 domain-containing protein [Flavobacterium salilacus subsp. salilacus]|uniref:DUF4349 domain-containing protein n=1 Tax=Flavobacterium TaxID=237 RepID=UPI001075628E|nr:MULTISPECIES: DUF4349 domain-containing protein [Flavobacterium]KAF2519036.1 DUF4349 domain-containing protein [Flavobacterium salilacus subsp. salilacus]MBE1614800.1 DUF4349 domain-containing protein [Flavobacterium sp. SaA2.13]
MKKCIYSLFVLLALAGCKDYSENDYDSQAVEAMSIVEETKFKALEADKAVSTRGNEPTDYDPKIIKNANLAFETDDLNATANTIQTAVKKYKAQVQHDSESKSSYRMSRDMVIRIPSKHFENFIADIGTGVAYFDRKEISAQDVTEEYIDIEARIKAKKTLENRYLELLKKAGKVSEMLEIEKELSAIREEIEAQQGRLNYMKNRVAMSTVNIEFYKITEAQADATISYGSKMGNAIKSGFNSLSSFFIGLLYLWPFILIFVVTLFIVRRKLKRKKYKSL